MAGRDFEYKCSMALEMVIRIRGGEPGLLDCLSHSVRTRGIVTQEAKATLNRRLLPILRGHRQRPVQKETKRGYSWFMHNPRKVSRVRTNKRGHKMRIPRQIPMIRSAPDSSAFSFKTCIIGKWAILMILNFRPSRLRIVQT